jgi:hypothetical protein
MTKNYYFHRSFSSSCPVNPSKLSISPKNPCGIKHYSAQKIPPASYIPHRKFPLQAIFRTLPSGYGRVYTLHTPEGREGEFSWGEFSWGVCVVIYNNVETSKLEIVKQNVGKIGVYR